MAQHMGRNFFGIEPSFQRQPLEQLMQSLAGEKSLPPARTEEIALGARRIFWQKLATHFQIGIDRRARTGMKRRQPLLAALAPDQDKSVPASDAGQRQPRKLRHPEAAGIQHLDNRRQALAFGGLILTRRVEHRFHIGGGKNFGQWTAAPGRIHRVGGIVGAHLLGEQKTVKLPERGKLARLR